MTGDEPHKQNTAATVHTLCKHSGHRPHIMQRKHGAAGRLKGGATHHDHPSLSHDLVNLSTEIKIAAREGKVEEGEEEEDERKDGGEGAPSSS